MEAVGGWNGPWGTVGTAQDQLMLCSQRVRTSLGVYE
jgi:hypothetical protein